MSGRVVVLPLEAHPLYLISLDRISPKEAMQGATLLTSFELQRAMRLRSQADRERCIFIYAQVKWILGELLEREASGLQFSRNPHGKPYISGYPLHFNLSHTQGYALLGVHSTLPIGVDIEKERDIPLEAFLTPAEQADLPHAPTALWTAKEAYVKALGIGFSAGMPILTSMDSHFTAFLPPFHSFPVKHMQILQGYHIAVCLGGVGEGADYRQVGDTPVPSRTPDM